MVVQIHAVDTIVLASRPRLRRENVRFYRDLLAIPLVYRLCGPGVLVFRLRQREMRIEFADEVAVNRNNVRATFRVRDLQAMREKLMDGGYEPEFYCGLSLASSRVFVADPTGHRIELFREWPVNV